MVPPVGIGLAAVSGKPRGISAFLRGSVSRGSDGPPDRHSLPLPFDPHRIHIQNQKGAALKDNSLLMVDPVGIEPMTSALRTLRSPS